MKLKAIECNFCNQHGLIKIKEYIKYKNERYDQDEVIKLNGIVSRCPVCKGVGATIEKTIKAKWVLE